jgi:ribonuclease Z
MRPALHPRLINGRTGDPCVYIEVLHRPDSILFDCGDLSALSARHLLRVGLVAVSHAHIDHWVGFDQLLRVLVGREKRVEMVGPAGFAERVHHKLQAFTWNLIDRIPANLVFDVTEVAVGPEWKRARMRLHRGFALEPEAPIPAGRVVLRFGGLGLRAAILDHGTPSLGFAVEEAAHYNVWRNRLDERGLPVGTWLAGLKQAIVDGAPDDQLVPVRPGLALPLAELRDLVSVTPGQVLAYLTDFADHACNRQAAVELADAADLLFIEAPFLAQDAAVARDRGHLTARAAGEIARSARVRRIEPFHLSARYAGRESELLAEVAAAAGPECLCPSR